MAAHPGWPATLSAGPVTLSPPRLRDGKQWSELRLRNRSWLEKWEPSSPYGWNDRHTPGSWPQLHGALKKAARAGSMLPFMIRYGDRLAGQITVSNVVHGVQRSCTVGYWIDGTLAGRGIAPTALAMVVDHLFAAVGLHRVEVDIRPENAASLRVAEKLGLRREGYFERYLDIDGGWRDHVGFAITVEELHHGGLIARLSSLPVPPDWRASRSS